MICNCVLDFDRGVAVCAEVADRLRARRSRRSLGCPTDKLDEAIARHLAVVIAEQAIRGAGS